MLEVIIGEMMAEVVTGQIIKALPTSKEKQKRLQRQEKHLIIVIKLEHLQNAESVDSQVSEYSVKFKQYL